MQPFLKKVPWCVCSRMTTAECLAHSKCSVRRTPLWEPYMEVLMDQAPLPWLMFEAIQIIKTIKKVHSVSTVRGVAWHFLYWVWGWGQRQSKNPRQTAWCLRAFSALIRCDAGSVAYEVFLEGPETIQTVRGRAEGSRRTVCHWRKERKLYLLYVHHGPSASPLAFRNIIFFSLRKKQWSSNYFPSLRWCRWVSLSLS